MELAVIYTRFSPRPNVTDCQSCETQLSMARDYCKLYGYEIISEFRDENMSGGRADNRKGLQDALDLTCKRKGVLIFYSLSRLSRNVLDAIEICQRIDKAGANMVSLQEKFDTTSAMGKFIFIITAAFAQLERETTSERTTQAMQHLQKNGRLMGSRPIYGYSVSPDNHSLTIPAVNEQAIIRKIMSYHGKGFGLREICRVLEQSGITCRNGKWHHGTVQNIIKRSIIT